MGTWVWYKLYFFHHRLLALATDSTNHKANCTKVVDYENWPGGRDRTQYHATNTFNTFCSMNPWTCTMIPGWRARKKTRDTSQGLASSWRWWRKKGGRWNSVVEASEQIPRFCFELLLLCLNPSSSLLVQSRDNFLMVFSIWQNICQQFRQYNCIKSCSDVY